MPTAEKKNVYGKLLSVQKELKAPKGQYNSFGKYNYRSCEDILEGVKPLLDKYKATLFIADSLELIGSRFYVKAVAKFVDTESGDTVESSAYARESEEKKGMDSSQVTGATSSYARKYALNGLFLIDDTKDADTDQYHEQQTNAPAEKKAPTKKEKEFTGMNPPEPAYTEPVPEVGKIVTAEQLDKLKAELDRTGVSEQQILKAGKVEKFEDMSEITYDSIMRRLAKTKDKA